MKLEQVSDSCYAVLNEKNRVCDANSGLINLGGGVVIDTQSDLPGAESTGNQPIPQQFILRSIVYFRKDESGVTPLVARV